MDEIRNRPIENDDDWHIPDDERPEWSGSPRDEEVPFHIPRD